MDNKLFIIKRNGDIVPFDGKKIENAIKKANNNFPKEEQFPDTNIEETVYHIEKLAKEKAQSDTGKYTNEGCMTVEEIQDEVENTILYYQYFKIAKEYIKYRYTRKLVRDTTELEQNIFSLVQHKNPELQNENANKNATVIYTQRDLIAGETSKYMSKKLTIPKHIVEAHDNGILHFHDMDYYIQPMFNCCLVNIRDMFDNGTCINDKMIETPKSFQTACTVMTQIITAVSSSQYGGTSIDIGCLGKYLKVSEDKIKKIVLQTLDKNYIDVDEIVIDVLVKQLVQKELEAGCQTLQYQINTMATTNGQSPFVTLFMYLKEDDEYLEYTARVFEEIFKQRILGIKNKVGVYISPSFPKLVYVTSPLNNLSGGKYDYITKLAGECIAKRMMPDLISESQMKAHYEGNVFSPMGCRSWLSPWQDSKGNYKFEGRLTSSFQNAA